MMFRRLSTTAARNLSVARTAKDFARNSKSSFPSQYGLVSCRYFSADAGKGEDLPSEVVDTVPDISESQDVVLDAVIDFATASAGSMNPKWLVMNMIEQVHLMGDLPYWASIVAVTIGIRTLLLPIAIKTVSNGARMAVLKPEMQQLTDAFKDDPNSNDARAKAQYQAEMKNLFVKHKVNPLQSIMMPLFQFPIFISLFLGLREMGSYFPGLATGGTSWFTDLTAADPYYIFPVFNAITFFAMIEIAKDGMNMGPQAQTMNMVMRGLGVAMVPLTMSMPQAVFVYWSVNNVLSIFQTLALKHPKMREIFGIPLPPAPDANSELRMVNPLKNIQQMIKKELSTKANSSAEVVGSTAPKPPVGPPPVTFAQPPATAKKSSKSKAAKK